MPPKFDYIQEFSVTLPKFTNISRCSGDVAHGHADVLLYRPCLACFLAHLGWRSVPGPLQVAVPAVSVSCCFLTKGPLGLPGINVYTGYGALCREANELSGRLGIHEFRSWQLPRPANMDVYLHAPVTAIDKDSLPSPAEKPYLLLTRKRCLDRLPGAESHPIGSYAVVVMLGEP